MHCAISSRPQKVEAHPSAVEKQEAWPARMAGSSARRRCTSLLSGGGKHSPPPAARIAIAPGTQGYTARVPPPAAWRLVEGDPHHAGGPPPWWGFPHHGLDPPPWWGGGPRPPPPAPPPPPTRGNTAVSARIRTVGWGPWPVDYEKPSQARGRGGGRCARVPRHYPGNLEAWAAARDFPESPGNIGSAVSPGFSRAVFMAGRT
eukprot:gene15677-biopygen5204